MPLIPFYPSQGKFVRITQNKREQVGWGKFADAMESMVSLEKTTKWKKIRGGNDALPKAFAEKFAGKILYQAKVIRIEPGKDAIAVKFSEKGKLEII